MFACIFFCSTSTSRMSRSTLRCSALTSLRAWSAVELGRLTRRPRASGRVEDSTTESSDVPRHDDAPDPASFPSRDAREGPTQGCAPRSPLPLPHQLLRVWRLERISNVADDAHEVPPCALPHACQLPEGRPRPGCAGESSRREEGCSQGSAWRLLVRYERGEASIRPLGTRPGFLAFRAPVSCPETPCAPRVSTSAKQLRLPSLPAFRRSLRSLPRPSGISLARGDLERLSLRAEELGDPKRSTRCATGDRVGTTPRVLMLPCGPCAPRSHPRRIRAASPTRCALSGSWCRMKPRRRSRAGLTRQVCVATQGCL